ncbi:hypothetical protein HPA02_34830 [Bisbaumannia pacifica]|uniref:Uncharacterized protein n=1 Tax=Bisbaumannia pacifica TaxID=77098 RepID=A0A510XGV2_9GAMM|nr:hypothetical protein [Halomonas pacifica]GEK49200.1 hypothetical protein HPA02_34830 [Halomonas pacifica]
MDRIDELERRMEALERKSTRNEMVSMYLMDATLELSRAIQKGGSASDSAHAALATESVKQALEMLKDPSGHEGASRGE